jgi:RecA-family ATPase
VGAVVVSPGSIHPDTGRPYKWLTDPNFPILPPPHWLLDLYEPEHSQHSQGVEEKQNTIVSVDKDFLDQLPISEETKRLIEEAIPKGDRSEAMMTVLIALVNANLIDEQIFEVFETYQIGEKYKEKGASKRKWLQKQIHKARDYVTNRADVKQQLTKVPEVFTAEDLDKENIPEPDWVIEGLLPPGVALLAGPPKSGKTRLATNIALGLATGTKVLRAIEVQKCEVLFLCLEDSKWRIKDRLSALLDGSPFPSGLHLANEWPRTHQGGLEYLDKWLEGHLNVRLVVIDVLGLFRKPPSSRNVYQDEYSIIAEIKALADNHSIAILVIHHTNKLQDTADVFDKISGSTGLTAASDTVVVLERHNRASIAGKLYKYEPLNGSWTLLGDADKYCITKQRLRIIDYLDRQGKPKKTYEIAKALCENHSTIRVRLSKMVKDSQLFQPDRGLYTTHKHHEQTQQPQQRKQDKQT